MGRPRDSRDFAGISISILYNVIFTIANIFRLAHTKISDTCGDGHSEKETPVEKNMTAIVTAINNHQYLQFTYEGHYRKVIPFAYGDHITTHNKVMRGLQVAGSSSSGKFDFPKLFSVSEMTGVQVVDETFEIPSHYSKGDKAISPIEAEL